MSVISQQRNRHAAGPKRKKKMIGKCMKLKEDDPGWGWGQCKARRSLGKCDPVTPKEVFLVLFTMVKTEFIIDLVAPTHFYKIQSSQWAKFSFFHLLILILLYFPETLN